MSPVSPEQQHYLERILEITRDLSATVSLEQVLHKIAQAAVELTDTEMAGILLFDDASGELRFMTGTYLAQKLVSIPVPIESSIAGAAFTSRAPVIVPVVENDPRHYRVVQEAIGVKTHSLLAVPLQYQERCIGVVEIENKHNGATFSLQDQETLQALAAQAAIAVENARLVNNLERERRLAEAFCHVGVALNSSLHYDEVLACILEQISLLIPGDAANVMMLEDDGHTARVFLGRGYERFGETDRLNSTTIDIGQARLLQQMQHTRQPLAIADVERHPDWIYARPEHQWIKSYVGAPIFIQKQIVGFLNVQSATVGRFGPADAERLQKFSNHAAVAIQNARLHDELNRANTELEQRVADRTAELLRAHQHLRAILDTAGEGVVFTDVQGTIEYINPAMERLTGYTAREALGHNPRLWHSDQTPPVTHQRMWAALTRGETWAGELVNRRRNGTYYDAALTIAPLTNADGQTIGYVGVQRDITRQKELERLKDQFVSNVSHELRTPLNNILLHIDLLERDKPERRENYLRTLRREAERLRKMIEDLLDLSRLDRNVTAIQLLPTDLDQLLAQLVSDRIALARERGLTLTYESIPDLPLVMADASQLIQVASNLLTNALNYTPAGGVVTVNAEVRQQEEKQLAVFTVHDTGPGISTQDLSHLFERFYRGTAGRQANAPGTGLGLAISQEIIERLGGRITVENEVGQGAAFTVWLPVV